MLLRMFCQHVVASHAQTSSSAALIAHLASAPNPPSTTPRAPSESLSNYSWATLLSACVDFLTDTTVTSETYELHTQVLSLALVLLSTQVTSSEILRGQEVLASSDSAAAADDAGLSILVSAVAASAATGGAGLQDPYLRASMIVGAQQYHAPVRGKGAVKGKVAAGINATSAPPATATPVTAAVSAVTKAQALIRSLLRNIAIDGARTEDSSSPGPSESSAACKASLEVITKRNAACQAYVKSGQADGGGAAAANTAASAGGGTASRASSSSSTTSSAGAAVGAIDRLAGYATSVVKVPVSLVGSFFFDSVEPVGKPLAGAWIGSHSLVD